jgi:hypothetical protein
LEEAFYKTPERSIKMNKLLAALIAAAFATTGAFAATRQAGCCRSQARRSRRCQAGRFRCCQEGR